MALSATAKKAAAMSMASRISARTGIPIVTIFEIIMGIITQLQNCSNPSSKKDGEDLIAQAVENHPFECPWWLRHHFKSNGVKKIDQINNAWASFVEDAEGNSEAAAALLVS